VKRVRSWGLANGKKQAGTWERTTERGRTSIIGKLLILPRRRQATRGRIRVWRKEQGGGPVKFWACPKKKSLHTLEGGSGGGGGCNSGVSQLGTPIIGKKNTLEDSYRTSLIKKKENSLRRNASRLISSDQRGTKKKGNTIEVVGK